MSPLPPPGRWALGSESQVLAEALVLQAQREGLGTAWLAPEAGFLSNLSMLENLRLVHDWSRGDGGRFEADLMEALARLGLSEPDWLQQRPSQVRSRQVLQAAFLRAVLVEPAVLVLHPDSLAEAGPLATQLIAAFAQARLLLLAEPGPDWPAWPQPEPAVAAEDPPA